MGEHVWRCRRSTSWGTGRRRTRHRSRRRGHRDVLAGRTPLVLSGEIYATAALLGAVVFVVLYELTPVGEPLAAVVGGIAIFGLRVQAIRRHWSFPPLTRGA